METELSSLELTPPPSPTFNSSVRQPSPVAVHFSNLTSSSSHRKRKEFGTGEAEETDDFFVHSEPSTSSVSEELLQIRRKLPRIEAIRTKHGGGDRQQFYVFRSCFDSNWSTPVETLKSYIQRLLDGKATVPDLDSLSISNTIWRRSEVAKNVDELACFAESEIRTVLQTSSWTSQKDSYENAMCSLRFLSSTVQWIFGHHDFDGDSRNKFVSELIKNIRSILLVLNLHNSVVDGLSESASDSAKFVAHIRLEVLWSCLELSLLVEFELDRITERFGVVDSHSSQVFNNILQESVFLVISHLVRVKIVWNQKFKMSTSLCKCVSSMWWTVHHLIKQKTDCFQLSFWGCIGVSMDSILYPSTEIAAVKEKCSDEIYIPFHCASIESVESQDSIVISLDLLLRVTEILKDDPFSGCADIIVLDESCEDLLKRVLQCSLSQKKGQRDWETKLKIWVPIFAKLILYSHGRIRQAIFEHFWKIFNDNMSLPVVDSGGSLGATLQFVSKTPADWVEKAKQYREKEKPAWRAWDFFLQLVAIVCKGSLTDWNMVKSKTMAQMTTKRLTELSLAALFDSLTLFLVLALEAKDFSKWLRNVLRILEDQLILRTRLSKDIEKTALAWRLLGAMILVCYEQKNSCFEVAARLANAVSQSLDYFEQIKTDKILANHMVEAFRDYVQAICFAVSIEGTFCDGIHGLFDVPFDRFIAVFPKNSSSVSGLVSVGKNLVQKLLEMSRNQEEQTNIIARIDPVARSLKKSLVQTVLRIWRSDQCSMLIAEFLAAVAELETKLPGNNQTFLMDVLKSSDKVKVEYHRRFLFLVITAGMELAEIKDFESLMISSWLRCCLLDAEESTELMQLTDWIFNLKTVKQCTGTEPLIAFSSGAKSCKALFRAVEEAERNFSAPKREDVKSSFQVWFGNTISIVESCGPSDVSLNNACKILGSLACYCSKLIYEKASPFGGSKKSGKLLNLILSYILSGGVKLAAIRECLCPIVIGVLKFDAWINDQFLKRKILEIFRTFTPMRAELGSERMDHKLLGFLTQKSSSFIQLRALFMEEGLPGKLEELRKENQGEKKNKAASGIVKNLWLFYEQVVDKSDAEQVLCDLHIIFPCILRSLADKGTCNDSVQGGCRTVLKKVMKSTAAFPNKRMSECMRGMTETVIRDVLMESGFDQFTSAIETMCNYLEDSELKRAFGRKILSEVENYENKAGKGAGFRRQKQWEKLQKLLNRSLM